MADLTSLIEELKWFWEQQEKKEKEHPSQVYYPSRWNDDTSSR